MVERVSRSDWYRCCCHHTMYNWLLRHLLQHLASSSLISWPFSSDMLAAVDNRSTINIMNNDVIVSHTKCMLSQ